MPENEPVVETKEEEIKTVVQAETQAGSAETSGQSDIEALKAQLAAKEAQIKELNREAAKYRNEKKAAVEEAAKAKTLEEQVQDLKTRLDAESRKSLEKSRLADLTEAFAGDKKRAQAALKLIEDGDIDPESGDVIVEGLLGRYEFLKVAPPTPTKPDPAAVPAANGVAAKAGLTREAITNMSDEEYERRRPEILAAQRGGLIK